MNKFDGEHYWEIGKAEYPLSKIINEIQKAGFGSEKGGIKLCQKKIQPLV